MGIQVEEDFQKEKEKLIDDAVDKGRAKDEPLQEPGWGSWTGVGVTVSKKQERRRKRQELKRKQERAKRRRKTAAKRKDAKLKHVIISEKRNKKAATYQVATVP